MDRVYYDEKSVVKFELPNLTQSQIDSYNWLFEEGLKELFDEINPIEDFTGENYVLEFLDYELDEAKVNEETAKAKNLTYKAPLKIRIKLTDKKTGKSKESDVFMGDFPLMTSGGTFIINGIERVIINQIVRSYGVLFTADDFNYRKYFGAKIIPTRGSWLEFETSNKNIISVKIDRKRKIPVTTFLKAIGGFENQELKGIFAKIDTDPKNQYITSTLLKDPSKNSDEALIEVYKRIRPGDLVNAETAKSFIEAMFFDSKRYNLGKIGRYKINRRLNLDVKNDFENRILLIDDIIETVKEIIRLNNDPNAKPDDVDNLKNRRIRSVGELVQSRLRIGILRMERIVKDRMAVADPKTITPAQLINNRPLMAVLQEFFASSQLSQFMDQVNPVSEIEHKRKLAATGPGGLSRERAGFEVRDVHPSHYNRICPIHTPEGPNIGLVGQMSIYSRVNEYGFIEAPFYKVKLVNSKPKVTNEVVYLDAYDEEKFIVAPASTEVNNQGFIIGEKVLSRTLDGPKLENAIKIQLVDISPRQLLSLTSNLIPFIENDEATRALMGSNMMKQAVPLVKSDSPYVGTGIEKEAARDSGQIVYATDSGIVKSINENSVTVKYNSITQPFTHTINKFIRSNQATCINQTIKVTPNQSVKKGDIIAESNSIENGEIALGKNLLVAFMSYRGSNYEDAIVISDRLIKDDSLTSIHIEKYSIEVRDTKLGPEIITRDIPNVGDEALFHLDEDGIARIGAIVKSGDILVGKISPKGETELTAEEKLLRAIFGEKAKDVMDSSLRLPHGEFGKVIGIKIFSKDEGDELPSGVHQVVEISIAQLRKIQAGDKMAGRHGNKGVISKILPAEDMPFLADGTPVDIILNPLGVVSRMNLGQILETHLGWAASKLNIKVASPVFNGVTLEKIESELEKANLPKSGKIKLYDGVTGKTFDKEITVGIIYMMKLIHMVDDKIHARSIGPYSMVTQQPLGGKAQFGGQRFGEMEVWALEAYGAAHTLQEMLTIKSDDVIGRSKTYESIIKNENIQKPSIPASFSVLLSELRSLGLNIETLNRNNQPVNIINQKNITDTNRNTIYTEKPSLDEKLTEIFAEQEKNPPKFEEKEEK
ncbi:DNA-directed RNA polymerase subunit beta [Candidatus Berkelbacteria bacterium CG10_big_fil_rev_8_21_14_0_10_33_10]|nr:MAG: DNA-directed RNA polymerase subunit beta [Candidatus Berkelbacteria bacterium CG10_big_fil_rev_8_21_14_0_10_33_10]